MSERRKYHLSTGVVLLLGFYVFMTEVLGRWTDTYQTVNELRAKEVAILEPDQIAQKKLRLVAEKTAVLGRISLASKVYDQNETGVFEFLSAAAKESNMRFESLIPAESESNGEFRQIGFRITTRAGFHRIGKFVNQVEMGILNVRLERIELTADDPYSAQLEVNVGGSAYVFPRLKAYAK